MTWMILNLTLMGCGDKATDTGTVEVEPVNATLRLLSVTNGQPISDVSVESDRGSELTGDDGRATVEVLGNSTYQMTASQTNSMNHIYHGVTGTDDFEVVGFLVDRSTTSAVFSMMGVNQDAANGIVVAALDNPDLSPAVGASASISASDSTPFIFGASGMPENGDTIQSGGGSFVFFPNVPTGTLSVSGLGQNETCNTFPAGNDSLTIDVEPDTVHVVVFSCSQE